MPIIVSRCGVALHEWAGVIVSAQARLRIAVMVRILTVIVLNIALDRGVDTRRRSIVVKALRLAVAVLAQPLVIAVAVAVAET